MNGANDNRCTSNPALAVYHHDTSRELDPQLHTHAVAANLTYDGTEGRWKALQASEIYERRAYPTDVYRMRWLARCVLSVMRSKTDMLLTAKTWVSKSKAFPKNCLQDTVSAVSSAIRPLPSLFRRTIVDLRTTKSPFLCASRGPTSWSKFRVRKCIRGNRRVYRPKKSCCLTNFVRKPLLNPLRSRPDSPTGAHLLALQRSAT
jgi:hypothetical protein